MRNIDDALEFEFGYNTFQCDVLLTHSKWPDEQLKQWSTECSESAPPVDMCDVDETESFEVF